MSLEEQIIAHADELRPVRWIARKLNVTRTKVLEVLAAAAHQERRESQSRNRVNRMISDARRSNMPVKLNLHTREFDPKIIPQGNGGRGQHFLPSGLPDGDFEQMRNSRERQLAVAA